MEYDERVTKLGKWEHDACAVGYLTIITGTLECLECGEDAALREKKPPDKDLGRQSHKAMTMVEEDNIDWHCPEKRLPCFFPVLLEEGEDITIEDIKQMVDKATNSNKDGKDFKKIQEELHELDKIIQEFSRWQDRQKEMRSKIPNTWGTCLDARSIAIEWTRYWWP